MTKFEILTDHFRKADAAHKHKLVCEALRIAIKSNGVQLQQATVDQVLAGSFEAERLPELCHYLRIKSVQSDELYLEQEEAGESEAVWGIHFHRARAYAAMAEFCERVDPSSLEVVLYEALQAQVEPYALIPRFIEILGVADED